MSRRDWPLNPTYEAPWTLNLANTANLMQPPGGQAQQGEIPANWLDVRYCRGLGIQIDFGTVVGASCIIELQWSITGSHTNAFSMGSAYQAAIAAGTPATSVGFNCDRPWFPWLKVAVIGAASSGTASIYMFARD